MGIEAIDGVLKRNWLRWFVHVEKKEKEDWVGKYMYMEVVVVVVFIFQYGNIHLHISGSIFINKNIFEKKTIWKSEIAHQNKS